MTQDLVERVARALSEIAAFATEAVAVREAGFTTEALRYPRDSMGLAAICAFNGITPDNAPRGWHYYPNAGTKKQWERVVATLTNPLSDIQKMGQEWDANEGERDG